MSVQFGRWNFEGGPIAPEYIEKVQALLLRYGPDGGNSYSKAGVSILYRAFRTTRASRREIQPHVTKSSEVLTWDGRLDNGSELIHELGSELSNDSTDLSIVATAYEHWGKGSFRKLVGDWALSIWNPAERCLVLAKDPVGTHQLYYFIETDHVTWSTILDPLVLFAAKTFALCEEYIAGWFSSFPAVHLTPYVGIHSLPPSSFALLRLGTHTIKKYWDFDPTKRIRYRTDGEYEEHFRTVFAEAVRRRLRSDSPILAELSGGMDSSSIVCMADTIIARGAAETPRLDTISYYNDSEPNWNERPYFSKVEEKRGRMGCHVDVGLHECLKFEFECDRFAATPDSLGRSNEATKQFAAYLNSQGNRVVLSGIGGDEVTGGVPTATPELEDLLAKGHFRALAHQLKLWALNKRKPWFLLLCEAFRGFFPPALVGVPEHMQPAPWLRPSFVKRHRAPLTNYESRLRLLGPLPTFQENLSTLNLLRRQIACSTPSAEPPYEKRYPYLDRDLLEFLYGIPREQLVRPGQRRSLMRRALIGIVPQELLNRKRKAYVARAPMEAISTEWAKLAEMSQHMVSSIFGIVDPNGFCEALQRARHGQDVPMVALMRTVRIESWLKAVLGQHILIRGTSTRTQSDSHLGGERVLTQSF
jgi:asparagine synthase (glutamine-hydrolysing)